MATPVSNRSLAWDVLRTAAHAWQVCPTEAPGSTLRDRWLPRLPAKERAQYEQLQTERSRESYLAGRALCRATLSRYTGVDPCRWRFGVGLHGKPNLLEPSEFTSLRFNLTHTDDLVICLVSRAGEVGVDTEKTTSAVDSGLVARHFLSLRQQARLATLPAGERAIRFFEQWVLKEAYVKATGQGLAYAPERLSIDQDENGNPASLEDCQFYLWRPTPSHVAAAALRRNAGLPVSFDWFRLQADLM